MIHVALNVKTKEILALEVTDEKVHDGRMLTKLANHVLVSSNNSNESETVKIQSVLADGAYDSNTNFFGIYKKKG
ncbi:hypothetical protein BH23THE1_BH23THE1_24110 [soil metagenome]